MEPSKDRVRLRLRRTESARRGIANVGNSCYANACVQMLNACDTFAELIARQTRRFVDAEDGNDLDEPNVRVLAALCALVTQLRAHDRPAAADVSPTAIMRRFLRAFQATVSARAFRTTDSNDAHEFLLLLLDRLERAEHTLLRHGGGGGDGERCTTCFGLRSITTTTCGACEYSTVSPPQDTTLPTVELCGNDAEALRAFFGAETVSEWKCDACRTQSPRTRKDVRVWQLPRVLLVHVARFTGGGDKRTEEFGVSDVLDLSAFVAPRSPASAEVRAGVRAAYRLMGSVVHSGRTVVGGHYRAVVRCLPRSRSHSRSRPAQNEVGEDAAADATSEWYIYDDDVAYSAASPLTSGLARETYLVAYERITP